MLVMIPISVRRSTWGTIHYTDTQGTTEFVTDSGGLYALESPHTWGELSVTTGVGADVVSFDDFMISGNITLNVGSGDDFAQVHAATVGGNVTLGLGAGTDYGLVEGVDASGVG